MSGPQPGDEQVERENARKRIAREKGSTAVERQRRLQSRRAFRGLSRREALELARSRHPEFVLLPAWRAPGLPFGHRIVGYGNDDFVARVAPPDGGADQLVVSTVPLRATDQDGDKRPVDLSLDTDGAAYRPRNPLTEVRLSEHLRGGMRLSDSGLVVRPAVDAEPAPALSGDTLFYANALTDADILVRPLPGGFALHVQIRSEDSPEHLALDLDVPRGVTLHQVGHSQVEARRGDEVIAVVTAPLARDADGRPVELSWRLDGMRLEIDVPHRGRDYAYPLLVDPDVVETYEWERYGMGGNYGSIHGWSYLPYGNFANLSWAGNSTWLGNGLYIRNLQWGMGNSALYFNAGESGAWYFGPHGLARIDQVEFAMFDQDYVDGTCTALGIGGPGGWRSGSRWEHCGTYYNQYWRSYSGQPQDNAVFKVWASTGGHKPYFASQLGVVYLHMSDPDPPSLASGLPNGWVSWDRDHELDVWAVDASLGIRDLTLSTPPNATTPVWRRSIGPETYVRCGRTYLCPRSHVTQGHGAGSSRNATVGDMPEGINDIQVIASDPAARKRAALPNPEGIKETPVVVGNGLRGEYYQHTDLTGPELTRLDPQINFDWGEGAPAGATVVGAENFAVRWSGYVHAPETGAYTFQTATDDGVRLWVRDLNQPIVNDWRDHGETARTGTVHLEAGKRYHIVMEYYEGGGGAVARLRWKRPGTSTYVIVPSDRLSPPGGWTLKLDRGAPSIQAPSGALWDRRNQTDDHRREGLYEASYTANLWATDGSTASDRTQRSGVKAINVQVKDPSGAVVLDSPDPEPQGCAVGSCDKHRPFTLNTDGLPDGDYTIEVTAVDQINHVTPTPTRWDVTIDRRGDVYRAYEYNRDPGSGGVVLATERHKLNTTLSRREEDRYVATRHTIACSQDETRQCAEVRALATGRDAGDETNQHLLITRGTSVDDQRLDGVSAVRQLANENLGDAEGSGSILDVAEPWQQPPPGNDGTYIRQDSDEDADIDDAPGQVTRRLYLDAVTRLPIREIIAVDGAVERRLFYTYDRHRLTDDELPAAEFAVERTDSAGTTETQDYATDPPEEPADDPADSEDPSTAQSGEYRSAHGLSTAPADIAAAHDSATNGNYDRSLSAYGVPLTAAEQAELDERDRAIDAARQHIEPYGRGTAASTYAGVWLDQAAGGVIRVSFIQDADQHLEQIRTFYPFPDRLQASTGSATLTTLVQVRDAIDADMENLALEGIQINSLYEDIGDNSVKVGLDQPSGIVEAALRLRYGPEVTVEEQRAFDPQQGSPPPGSDRRRSKGIPPVYAGLKMYSRHETGAITPCSTAFSMIDAEKHRRVLSAGHCSDVNRTWFHRDSRIGQTSVSDIREYQDPGRRGDRPVSVDVQQIRVRSGYITSRVYARPRARDAYRQMQRQIAVDEGPQGKEVCTVGYRRTPPRCGRLVSTTATVRTQFGLMYRMGLWNFDGSRTHGGDSGGAVYSGSTAYGVHHGLDKNQPSRRAVFTPLPNISRLYGTVVVTPDSLARLGFE